MSISAYFTGEAEALLIRLNRVRSFEQTMPMVAAANITTAARHGIHQLLREGVREIREKITRFIRWIELEPRPDQAQRQFALLKLKFNAFLDQMDIFSDVLTQRGEHETGVWIAGLDHLAMDAMRLNGTFFEPPPLVTYLDRGHGAAIRRARTRLPGGKSNPVAIIRVPRERMVSNGIASSLVHEVGHQGSALLGLIPSLRNELKQKAATDPANQRVWELFERWISEILSDFWSVAQLGVSATTGLMGVVSLPSYFVFRMNIDDPHPVPWIRVKISSAFGRALYPDRQWERLEGHWNRFYRLERLPEKDRELLLHITALIPVFVNLVIRHRPKSLKGQQLRSVFATRSLQPDRLRRLFRQWQEKPKMMKKAPPTLVFAVIGQAHADHRIEPSRENEILRELLSYWARQHAINH